MSRLVRLGLCGLLAGAAGTVALDLVWFIRYKRGGGEGDFLKWEFGSAPSTWDEAAAPAKLGKLLYETTTHRELPESRIAATTNVMHWGYGVPWGVLFAVCLGSRRNVRVFHGPLLGLLVWLSSYVALPIAGLYKPIWSYDLKTLWDDLSAHLVYGCGAAAAFWLTCSS